MRKLVRRVAGRRRLVADGVPDSAALHPGYEMTTIRSATPDDLPQVRRLLAANGLPTQDLDTTPIEFLVADDGGTVVGAVGLERFGDAALLRSLVVDAAGRGTGLGGALVTAIEARAVEAGATDLALLTTTAAPLFARRGWQTVPRDALPTGVHASGEFRSLCPASATAMTKPLKVTA